MPEAPLNLNLCYVPDSIAGRPISLGKIYIGIADTDPEVLANRIDVVVIQEDGSRVVIPPASQPLTTGPGGVVIYDGSPVVVLVNGSHSIKVLDATSGQKYYIPQANNYADSSEVDGAVIKNGSFEIETQTVGQPDNWTITQGLNGTVLNDTDSAHGLKCLKFTSTDATGGGVAKSEKFDVLAGSEQVIKFTYKSSAADTRNKLEINWYNTADTLVSTTTVMDEGAANPAAYTTIQEVVNVPASCVRAEIVLTGMDGSGTTVIGTTQFDNIEFKDTQINRVLTMLDTPVQLYQNNAPPNGVEETIANAVLTNAGASAALVTWHINCVSNSANGFASSASGVVSTTIPFQKLAGTPSTDQRPYNSFTIGLDGSQQFYIMHSGTGTRASWMHLNGYWS
jgi:hypothetical protein